MTKWAALFPGQGSQHPGMGKDIFDNFKSAKLVFEEASDAVKLDIKKLCFEGPESELKLTANAQPALLVTSIAAWRVFAEECELRPTVALGHSLGEYSALVAAGALSFKEAVVTVRLRGQAMQNAVPVGTGSMLAVLGMEDEAVIRACHDLQNRAQTQGGLKNCVVEAANFNGPGQVVISGHNKALAYFKENLIPSDYGANRAKLIPLPVSAPFHCSLMKPAAEQLKPQLEKLQWRRNLDFEVIHNVNSQRNRDGSLVKNFLYEQMTKPVLWTTSILHAGEDGIHHYVEFGAGKILSGLVRKISPQSHTLNMDGMESFKSAQEKLETL